MVPQQYATFFTNNSVCFTNLPMHNPLKDEVKTSIELASELIVQLCKFGLCFRFPRKLHSHPVHRQLWFPNDSEVMQSFLVACYATLHPALSVRLSVRRSVRRSHFTFSAFMGFLAILLLPKCSTDLK